jgi:hypothetical protein
LTVGAASFQFLPKPRDSNRTSFDRRSDSASACWRAEKEDLYRVDEANPRLYIETRYSYEDATREGAILKYEKYSYDNKFNFDTGTSSDVKALR